MAKKFGDVVSYVRNGVTLNALVVQSTQTNLLDKTQPSGIRTEEHLTVIYLDPALESGLMSGSAVDRSVAKAFGVAPLVDGGVNGWKEKGKQFAGLATTLQGPQSIPLKAQQAQSGFSPEALIGMAHSISGIPPQKFEVASQVAETKQDALACGCVGSCAGHNDQAQ